MHTMVGWLGKRKSGLIGKDVTNSSRAGMSVKAAESGSLFELHLNSGGPCLNKGHSNIILMVCSVLNETCFYSIRIVSVTD